MTSMVASARRLGAPTLTLALLFAMDAGHAAHAQYAAPSYVAGQLRGVQVAPYSGGVDSGNGTASSSSSSGASGAGSSTPWPTSGGCDTTQVYQSLSNSANFSYAQTYANDANTVQQPQSYSSCLAGLLKEAQTISDMFTSGFSIAGAISGFADMAVNNIIDGLENKVCSTVQKAANGVFGSINKDLSQLNGSMSITAMGQPLVNLNVTATPTSMNPTTVPTSITYPMPVQTPAPPIVVPTPPTAPPPHGASSGPG